MSDKVKAENNGDADDLDAVPLPVYAEDLAENVRKGFDLTCDFVLRCNTSLQTKIDKRFDDLGAQIGALQTIVENMQVPARAAHAPLPIAPPPHDGRVGDRPLPAQPPARVAGHVGDADLPAGYVPR